MKKSALQTLVESIFELLLTSWVLMLLAGALGKSLDWGTLSFLQTLGSLYALKTLVSSLTLTYYTTLTGKLKADIG